MAKLLTVSEDFITEYKEAVDYVTEKFDEFKNNLKINKHDLVQNYLNEVNFLSSDLIDRSNDAIERKFKYVEKHKTVAIKHPNGIMIDIDEQIAPLISTIWELGIKTVGSCENFFPINYCWISFETIKDINLFCNIVFENNNEFCYKATDSNSLDYKEKWHFFFNYFKYDQKHYNNFWIRFPVHQLKYITSIFQLYAYTKKQKKQKDNDNKFFLSFLILKFFILLLPEGMRSYY